MRTIHRGCLAAAMAAWIIWRLMRDAVSQHLYTRHLPDPDLVIRTSGEMRLSNFLLWQLAYAEIYVTPTLWPEFRGVHLLEGIAEYQKREASLWRTGGRRSSRPQLSPSSS